MFAGISHLTIEFDRCEFNVLFATDGAKSLPIYSHKNTSYSAMVLLHILIHWDPETFCEEAEVLKRMTHENNEKWTIYFTFEI